MANFRVRDLEALAAQLRAAGIEVVIDTQDYPNGRCARRHDPESNPIQLWRPPAPAVPARAHFRIWAVGEPAGRLTPYSPPAANAAAGEGLFFRLRLPICEEPDES